MLPSRTLGVTIGLALAIAVDLPGARAQPPQAPPAGAAGGVGPGGMPGAIRPGMQSPVQLLMAPTVQKELKLTEAQKTKVYALSRTAGQKFSDFTRARMLSAGNPQAIMAQGQQLRQEIDREIATILDAKQTERLNQISLQVEGPLAVARPEVAAKLNVNRTQQEYIQGIMQDLQQGQGQMMMMIRRNAMAGGAVDPNQFAQMRTMTADLRKEAVQQISKILDKKQKANFNKMLGEPFDIDKIETGPAPNPNDAPAASTDEAKPKEKEDDPAHATTPTPTPEKEAPKGTGRPARKKSRT